MSDPKTVERKRTEMNDAAADDEQRFPVTGCCEKIREAAYFKWESSGRPCGDGVEFWLQAEVELAAETPPSPPK